MINLINVEKQIDSSFRLGPISVTVEPGTMTALIGNNGAGKSTLFHVMMDLVKKDQGEIVRESSNDKDEWKRYLSYVPQIAASYYGFNLIQLAEFFQIAYEGWDNEEFTRLVHLFDLPKNKRVENFSVGMQKKAMITLALSRPSKLLLLDEPLAGVDIEGQEQIKDELVHYMERSDEQTVLFATHSADEVKTLADYIFLLKDGQFVGKYEKDQLIEAWKRIWIRMSEEQARKRTGIIAATEQGELVECITTNIEETEQDLGLDGRQIESIQVMELREILRHLLQRK